MVLTALVAMKQLCSRNGDSSNILVRPEQIKKAADLAAVFTSKQSTLEPDARRPWQFQAFPARA